MAKSKAKSFSGQALKDFRHKVAILKSKGLTSHKVDARSQKATAYYKAKVRKLADVIEGRYTGLKVSKDVLKAAKAAHQRVYNGRVLAPAGQPKMQAEVRAGRFLETITNYNRPDGTPTGFRRREIDLSRFYSMKQFMETFDDHPHDLDKLRPRGMQFAFTYFGNRSRNTFPNAEEMLGRLRNYLHVSGITDMDGTIIDADEMSLDQLWEGFSVFSVENDGTWERESSRIAKARKADNRKRYMRKWKRKNEDAYNRYMDYQAEKQQRHRAKLTGGALEDYRQKAKARAQKSRDNAKAKKAKS